MKDMSQRLILGTPVQEVIPVVAAGDLLLTVYNAAMRKEYFNVHKKHIQLDTTQQFYCNKILSTQVSNLDLKEVIVNGYMWAGLNGKLMVSLVYI